MTGYNEAVLQRGGFSHLIGGIISNHIGFPAERRIFVLTVQKVVIRNTEFGPIADHTFVTPEWDVLFWAASNASTRLVEGQTYVVKATIKTHDVDDSGVKRTILLRVVEHFEPARIPRMAVGLIKGSRRH